MKKEPMHCLGMVSWLVTAVVAVHAGLVYFGYNFFSFDSITTPWVATTIMAVVLVSGIMSLVMYAMTLTGKGGCNGSGCGTC